MLIIWALCYRYAGFNIATGNRISMILQKSVMMRRFKEILDGLSASAFVQVQPSVR